MISTSVINCTAVGVESNNTLWADNISGGCDIHNMSENIGMEIIWICLIILMMLLPYMICYIGVRYYEDVSLMNERHLIMGDASNRLLRCNNWGNTSGNLRPSDNHI